MNVLIIKMGGSGTRFGSDIPKQYHLVNGKPLFTYILKEYESVGKIDKYLIVSNKDWINYSRIQAKYILGEKLLDVIVGGDTGAKSIQNGIIYLKSILEDDDIVLLHDATNPIVVKEKITEIIDAAKQYGFASLGMEQVHAIYSKDANNFATGSIVKNSVVSGYSPEAFEYKYLYDCYAFASHDELEKSVSAIEIANKHDLKAKIIVASFLNLKITYKNDLEVYKKLCE